MTIDAISKQIRTQDLEYIPDPSLAAREYTPEEIVGAERWAEMPEDQRRQLALELDGWVAGMYRTRARNEGAINRGEFQDLAPVKRLLREWSGLLAAVIREQRDKYEARRRYNMPPWFDACATLDDFALAEVVMQSLITGLLASGMRGSRSATVTEVCLRIGRDVDVTRRMAEWLKKRPKLHRAYTKRLNEAGATRKHRRKVMLHGINNKLIPELVAEGEQHDLDAWDKLTGSKIGKGLLLLALKALGGRIVLGTRSTDTAAKANRRKNPTNVLELDAETKAWIAKGLRQGEIESRRPRPMVCPPLPWRGPRGGGYLLGALTSSRIMLRTGDEGWRSWAGLTENPRSARRVYDALNYLGNTALRVRKGVLAVALEARDAGLALPDLPVARPRIPVPPKPDDIETNEEARAQYRQARARIEEANRKAISRELANEDTLAEAELYAAEPAIYFPHGCDHRSRMYPLPSGLNAQGSDLRRALLEVAHGKPIFSADASAGWLAIQVAKTFGKDKLPFEERIQWVFDNEELIRAIADDPLGNRELWENSADNRKIWQTLAACQEWRDFRDHGDGFVSHLPVYIDGTCNGIQHFAALARDPELARLVNLTPTDKPQDIYAHVGAMGLAKMRRRAEAGGEGATFARAWLKALEGYSIRKLAKPIVMTKPYGGTALTAVKAVRKTLRKDIDPNNSLVTEDDEPKAAGVMGKALRDSLAEVLYLPDRVLDWVRACVEAVNKYGLSGKDVKPGVMWVTPTGWTWGLMYGREGVRELNARLDEQRLCTVYREVSTKVVDLKRQKQAACPNFVHALDAAAMVFALNLLDGSPVQGVIAIHDSVGALAADMPLVDSAVREGFVQLYRDHDPLKSFHAAILEQIPEEKRKFVPEPPELGEFDIEEVLNSPYFFS